MLASGQPNDTIKDALRTYRRNGHYCVVVAYSAGASTGCLRDQPAERRGHPTTGML
jgi:hypothetical protein